MMKTEMVDPATIAANPWNSNVVPDDMREKLRASMKRHGIFKPSLVRELADGSLQSIGGWHRTEEAAAMQLPQIPVVNLGQISDEKAKEISLADNARYGYDDAEKLAMLLSELDAGVLTSTMPYDDDTIGEMTRSLAVDIDDLDLDGVDGDINEEDLEDDEPDDEKIERTVRDHQLLRFKVGLADAPKVSKLLTKIMREHGYTKEDDLTNAGDALVHLATDYEKRLSNG